MLSVPVEILREIFELCQSNELEPADHWETICFSQVCRLWRQVAHGSSQFWSTISLDITKREPNRKAAFWIERAGNRHLSIEILCGNEGNGAIGDHVMSTCLVDLALVLRDSMHRWKSFSIQGALHYIKAIFQICSGYVPNLRNLSIEADGGYDPLGSTFPILLFFPFDPRPGFESSNLSVSATTCIPWFMSLGLAITDLSIDFQHLPAVGTAGRADQILFMFQSCPNILRCNLDEVGQLLRRGSPGSVVRMESLSELRLHMAEDIDQLLGSDVLELLSLRSLHLDGFNWTVHTRHALWDIFQRCSRVLTTIVLTLSPSNFCNEVFGPIDGRAPVALDLVTNFTIHGHPNSYPLLRALSLPRVQELVLVDIPFHIIHQLITASSPSIVDLSVQPLGGFQSETPIYFPSLLYLRIHDTLELLDQIHAPELRNLHLGNCRRGNYDPVHRPFLHDFIARSKPALKFLLLEGIRVHDEDLIRCMESLSHLKDLSLYQCDITDSVLQALARPSAGPEPAWLLPQLEEISLLQCDALTPRGIIEFFTSRSTPLNSTTPEMIPPQITGAVRFTSEINKQDFALCKSLGINVEICGMER
ncbi:hypothetical protein BOTBODRAFT_497743 [Botryobasidium botryosum FD-172 SS1]|uniref:F-box domain-containing protein n=1 Tax=Botryobasidium botryosum (strain FD-172 SS1) TaxID=930990 RepID=A0A067M408_BOTB1|nr:hypothetical protein BOTBODRAFT_497743 [Botryobasidium botryosum FD-172 SS1]